MVVTVIIMTRVTIITTIITTITLTTTLVKLDYHQFSIFWVVKQRLKRRNRKDSNLPIEIDVLSKLLDDTVIIDASTTETPTNPVSPTPSPISPTINSRTSNNELLIPTNNNINNNNNTNDNTNNVNNINNRTTCDDQSTLLPYLTRLSSSSSSSSSSPSSSILHCLVMKL